MDFDADAVETEVRAVFDGYEAALGTNDVAALTAYFWQSPRAVRLMTDGGLYGIEAIAAFRKGRDVSDLARELTRVDIVALGPDVAVATVYRDERRIRRLLAAVALIGLAYGALALAQDLTRAERIYWRVPIAGLARSGTFFNHSHYGQFMNLSVGCALALLLARLTDAPRMSLGQMARRTAWLAAMIVVGLATISLSLTRGGTIGILASAAFATCHAPMLRAEPLRMWAKLATASVDAASIRASSIPACRSNSCSTSASRPFSPNVMRPRWATSIAGSVGWSAATGAGAGRTASHGSSTCSSGPMLAA